MPSCPLAQVPMAKASVLWLVGEYCSLVPKIAPDVLRKAAKSFTEEVRSCQSDNQHMRGREAEGGREGKEGERGREGDD